MGADTGLERVGPTSTANGFPLWYQDKSGLALEFCSPLNQAEIQFADGVYLDGSSGAGGLWTLDFALAGTNDPRNPTTASWATRPTRVYASTSGVTSPLAVFLLR